MEIDQGSLIIDDDDLFLRPLKAEDVTRNYVTGINDPDVNRYLVDVRRNKQTHQSIVDFVENNWNSNYCILFGIFLKNEGSRLIGTIRVSEINWYHFNASIGICLFEKTSWKKGLAVRSVTLVKQFVFGNLSLHYLEAGAYATNLNSIKLFLSAGFKEAYRVKHKFRHVDSFEEVVYLSAINDAFDNALVNESL